MTDRSAVSPLLSLLQLDKIKRSERSEKIKTIREKLGCEENTVLVPFSSQTGEGRDLLLRQIGALLFPH